MPILVYVIQPQHTFLCKDEGDENLVDVAQGLNNLGMSNGGFIRFVLEGGQAAYINVSNIAMIRYISEEDVKESKKLAEKQRQNEIQQQKRANELRRNSLVTPYSAFPSGRRGRA